MSEPFIAAPPIPDGGPSAAPQPDRVGAAVALLCDHIASLPHEKYGVINMLPFAHDSDQVREVKHDVCEAIVNLLHNHGFIAETVRDQVAVSARAEVKCKDCGELIVCVRTDSDGNSMVSPHGFIASVARANPECPHKPITHEDLRQHMEREFYKAQVDE